MGRTTFDDGSTYDLKFGYRNAEKVKEDEANGVDVSLKMTEKEKRNLWEGALVVLCIGVAILAVVLGVKIVNNINNENQTIVNSIEQSQALAGSKVLKLTNDELLMSVMTENGLRDVVKCDVEKLDIGDNARNAYIFCDRGGLATLTIKLR